MAFSTIRRATDEDAERLNKAAERLIARYELDNGNHYENPRRFAGNNYQLWYNLDLWLHCYRQSCVYGDHLMKVSRAWERAKCRALRLKVGSSLEHSVGISMGYVGTNGW